MGVLCGHIRENELASVCVLSQSRYLDSCAVGDTDKQEVTAASQVTIHSSDS